MNIKVENNNLSYDEYKSLSDKYGRIDSREINYQNRIILGFLEKLFIDTDIIIADVSTLYYRGKRNPKDHDNFQYAVRNFAPPDLLITRNWHFDNKNNKVDYLAAIEVKSPLSSEYIHNREVKKYSSGIKKQLEAYLSVNSKVILTDCYRWQFFNREYGLFPIETIDLFDDVSKSWNEDEWKKLCYYIPKFVGEN